MWWKGPLWTRARVISEQTYHVDQETRDRIAKEVVLHEIGLVAESTIKVGPPFGITLDSFSSYHKLMRVTGWCLRFMNNYFRSEQDERTSGHLQCSEIQQFVVMWDKFVQMESFPEVFSAVIRNEKHSLNNLGVVINEDGVLVCKGRFRNSTRNAPKLLPKDNSYSKLVIERSHKRVLHYGVTQTLAELRKEYWVIQGRSVVRRVIRECFTCIKWEGAPFGTPDFAPLPDFVIVPGDKLAFAFIGLDYFGPLIVKENGTSYKVFGCLFTCLKVRAVHLEIVENMSTNSFLFALRRFIGRRGKPVMIVSDNASQFKQTHEIIDSVWINMLKDEAVQSYVAEEGIEWKWVTEYSPWKGGFYERLVGIAKRACRKALGKCAVSKEQLNTLLVEVEGVMNTRPLVYIGDDINSEEALTPAHFLGTNRKLGFPDVELGYTPTELTCYNLLDSWKWGQVHLNNFWKVWSQDYLQSLREVQTTNTKPIKGQVNRVPSIGEVVILKEELIPRGRWKLGRIESLVESSVDGVHQAAVVMTSSGKRLKRPYRMIYPLEAGTMSNQENSDKIISDDTASRLSGNTLPEVVGRKSTRAAATSAKERIRTNLRVSESEFSDE